MPKFKIGEIVIPHRTGETDFRNRDMIYEKPTKIVNVEDNNGWPYQDENGYYWPESALTPYEPNSQLDERFFGNKTEKPQYDLKEFVLAALTGLCANSDGVMTEDNRRSFHPNDISKVAVEIAKTTIWALKKENGQVTVREAEEHAEMEEKKPMYIENCTLEDAKRFWNNGQKLTAVKVVKVRKNCLLSQAKKYCEDNF